MKGRKEMKKQVILGIFMVSVSLVAGAVYAAHPDSPTSAQQVVAKPVDSAKSLWSGKVLVEMERARIGTGLTALSNATTLFIGRKLNDNVSLTVAEQVANSFKADKTKIGAERYLTVSDPVLILGNSNLFEVAGIKGSGDLRVALPLTEMSRQNRDDRNPHNGIYRYTLNASKAIDRWTLSASSIFRFYNFRSVNNEEGKLNNRYKTVHELALNYKLDDMFSVTSLVDLINSQSRVTYAKTSSAEWATSLDVEAAQNLSASLGLTLTLPNQSIMQYARDDQSKMENSKAGLTVSYQFL